MFISGISGISHVVAMNIDTVIHALQATTSNDNALRGNAEKALNEVRLFEMSDFLDDHCSWILS